MTQSAHMGHGRTRGPTAPRAGHPAASSQQYLCGSISVAASAWQTAGVASELHRWAVAAGILRREDSVLMVNNLRRNGSTDWTTPGGVVDPGETVLGALTREVTEETGLAVSEWNGPLYSVEADGSEGPGWFLRVEVYEAQAWTGELDIEHDPDGIVFDARWVPSSELEHLLAGQHPWMAEPLLACLRGDVERGHVFRYAVSGSSRTGLAATPAAS